MNEHGIVIEKGTIRFERVLPGPIERVWSYLTDSDKRAKWLAAGDMDLRVGGRVELTFHHADLSPHREPTPERFKSFENGVSLVCRVTQCDPPRLLGMTLGRAGRRVGGHLRADAARRSRASRPDPQPPRRPKRHGGHLRRLAYPPRHPRRQSRRRDAPPLLVELFAGGSGIREAHSGRADCRRVGKKGANAPLPTRKQRWSKRVGTPSALPTLPKLRRCDLGDRQVQRRIVPVPEYPRRR